MNVHDRFFKETFGDVVVTKDFLKHYLPEAVQQYIDVETLLPQKDSFIDEKLNESFSDLLFQAEIFGEKGYLYFLFEHKSSPDKSTTLQLLKYIVNIWETKKNAQGHLPVVVPLVIYQGAQRWNVPKYFGEMIQDYQHLPAELMAYIPNFTYQFYDFSYRSDEEIKGQAILKIYHTMIKEIFKPNNPDIFDSIKHALNYFSEIESKTRAIEYFETVMRYIFTVNKNFTKEEGEKMMKKIEEHYPEGKKVATSLADLFIERGKIEGKAEGKAEGKIEGKIEGKAEGIRHVILQLLTNKFGVLPTHLEKAIAKLELPILEKIAGNMFNYATIEDVEEDLKN